MSELQRLQQRMKIEDIYSFFENPPPLFLSNELTICYIASVLVCGNSYGTGLIQRLETKYPDYRVSDTVLYSGLKFLVEEDLITSYWKKVDGRGRPRRMYQIKSGAEEQIQHLARLWHEYSQASSPIKLEPVTSQSIR